MQKISIKNFGPIKEFESEVKNINLFIGPQASGKSTISKSIFIFKSLKNKLMSFILDVSDEQLEHPINEFSKYLRQWFVECFGTTLRMQSFQLTYNYSADKEVVFSLQNGIVFVNFNPKIFDELNLIFAEFRTYNRNFSNNKSSYTPINVMMERESERRFYLKIIEVKINELFEEHRNSVFIPAGRSLLSTLAEPIQNIKLEVDNLDFFMKSFVEMINYLKPSFQENLFQLIEDKQSLEGDRFDFERVELAVKIIQLILKGEYRFDTNLEKIYYNSQEFIKLNYASSGQQESVWILLLIFKYILDQINIFLVIEEPEAHLYPEAQKNMVELIALLANIPGNQVIITTHSPYILTAFNNLLYANKVGSEHQEVNQIVDSKIWVDSAKTTAYLISDVGYESIFDGETELIKAEKIDSASEIIDEEFDRILELVK
jgi:AAA15 family ATPase/GTPase